MSFWSSLCTACASIRLRESVEGGGRRPLGEGKGEWGEGLEHSQLVYIQLQRRRTGGGGRVAILTNMGEVLDRELLMIPRLR